MLISIIQIDSKVLLIIALVIKIPSDNDILRFSSDVYRDLLHIHIHLHPGVYRLCFHVSVQLADDIDIHPVLSSHLAEVLRLIHLRESNHRTSCKARVPMEHQR